MSQEHTDVELVDALENIADAVTQLVGFEVAAISIARGDETLEMIAVAGSAQARELLLGHRTPIAEIEQELATAEDWGDLWFVPYERMNPQIGGVNWVPDLAVPDNPDMWHPLDLLLAPIYDEDRRLRALMSVDLPRDRRRLDAEKREKLQLYVQQVRRAVLTTLERAELAEQVILAGAARMIVREASSELSMDRIIEVCRPALTTGLSASGMWIETFDVDGQGTDAVYGSARGAVAMPEELKRLGRTAAERLWGTQQTAVVTDKIVPSVQGLSPEDEQQVYDFMAMVNGTSMLFVPLGAGRECLGNLGLIRHRDKREWSSIERQAALDIGHDLWAARC